MSNPHHASRSPSFAGLRAATPRASAVAKASSHERDTSYELLLGAALRDLGLRSRVAPQDVPDRPGVVFRTARVVAFCDGDFWHGRDLDDPLTRLARGHDAPYGVAKIRRNAERDRRHDERLRKLGWIVLRFSEGDVRKDPRRAARKVRRALQRRTRRGPVMP